MSEPQDGVRDVIRETYDRYKDDDWPAWDEHSLRHHEEAVRRYSEDHYGGRYPGSHDG